MKGKTQDLRKGLQGRSGEEEQKILESKLVSSANKRHKVIVFTVQCPMASLSTGGDWHLGMITELSAERAPNRTRWGKGAWPCASLLRYETAGQTPSLCQHPQLIRMENEPKKVNGWSTGLEFRKVDPLLLREVNAFPKMGKVVGGQHQGPAS